jgi:hypothetical protein
MPGINTVFNIQPMLRFINYLCPKSNEVILRSKKSLTDILLEVYCLVHTILLQKTTRKRRLTEVMSGESHPDLEAGWLFLLSNGVLKQWPISKFNFPSLHHANPAS